MTNDNLLTSETFKKQYIDSEERLKFDLSKITERITVLNITKDVKTIDHLLDVYNYSKATYKVIMIQYLSLYIMTYLKEQNIIQNNDIPIKTAMKILKDQEWITIDMKDFIDKHFEQLMNGENLAKYAIDLNTYLNNADKF